VVKQRIWRRNKQCRNKGCRRFRALAFRHFVSSWLCQFHNQFPTTFLGRFVTHFFRIPIFLGFFKSKFGKNIDLTFIQVYFHFLIQNSRYNTKLSYTFSLKTQYASGFFLSPLGMRPRPCQLGKIRVVFCKIWKKMCCI